MLSGTRSIAPRHAVGTEVVWTIDWDFRYRMMRTHTALHILCGTIWKEFGVQVTGGQMYPDKARMDFAMENLNKERIAYIEQRINEAIEADYPIRVYTLPREKAFAIPGPDSHQRLTCFRQILKMCAS